MEVSPALLPLHLRFIEYCTKELPKAKVLEGLLWLQRFLFLLATYPAEDLSVSPQIDALWHKLLLFPVLYADVSKRLGGGGAPLPHDPLRADDVGAWPQRYKRTYELLLHHFQSAPAAWWPMPAAAGAGAGAGAVKRAAERGEEEEGGAGASGHKQPRCSAVIYVKQLPSGRTFPVPMDASFTTERLKAQIHEQLGIPAQSQRLTFKGRDLEGGRTLAEQGILEEKTLFLCAAEGAGAGAGGAGGGCMLRLYIKTLRSTTITLEAGFVHH